MVDGAAYMVCNVQEAQPSLMWINHCYVRCSHMHPAEGRDFNKLAE